MIRICSYDVLWIRGEHKTTLVEIRQDLDLRVEDILKIKDYSFREFIKLILSSGILVDKDKSFSDEVAEFSDAEILDKFMFNFIG